MRKTSGYTLIEILVALTIISLLFGVGYANFRDFTRRQAVLDASKKIQGDIRLAQGMALSGQKPNDAKCNAPNTLMGYNFKIYSASEYKIEANCTGGIATAPTKDVILASDVSLSTPSINPITFNVLGNGTNIPSGQNTTFNISQTGTTNKITLTISSGGQIQ